MARHELTRAVRILLLFVLSALCIGALAFGFVLWNDASPERVVEAEIAGARFSFPQTYARDDAASAGGMTDRLALLAVFPNFSAPKPRERAGPMMVSVTVSPKDDSPDPAERPTNLYARFLTEETKAGPGGLILRSFEANSPYDLELLYLAPPDGHSFFARCPKPRSPAGDACLSIFRDGALDIELRYAPGLLEHWDALYEGARAMLARLSAPRKKPRAPIK